MFDWYPDYEYHCARTQLVLFTLGMGMTLSLADFVEIARRPRSFAAALAGQLLLGPCLAVVINAVTDFEPGIKVGLILTAAMPGGALAKFFTYFGRGNMALSISLTGVTTLLTLATVPFMLQLLAAQHIENFTMPVGDIVIDVALCLVLPLFVGLTVGRLWPGQHRLLSKICIRLGLLVVIVMIIGSLNRIDLRQYGLGVPIAIILLCLIGQQLNMLPFRYFGWPRQDRMAAGIEITMRNMNLALLIKARLFSATDPVGVAVFFVILFYAGAAMGVGFPLALNHNRMARRESPAIDPAPEVCASGSPKT
jgi:BASS family bile acid:Na+ symporter